MEITIDTEDDSDEALRHVADFLYTLADDSPPTNVEESTSSEGHEADAAMSMFDDDNVVPYE